MKVFFFFFSGQKGRAAECGPAGFSGDLVPYFHMSAVLFQGEA